MVEGERREEMKKKGDADITADQEKAETRTRIHTHTYTHIQIDHQRGKGKEKPKEQEDGVKRTHREPRSHDLMNELAWLLATWWGGYSPSLPLPPLVPRQQATSSTVSRLSSPWFSFYRRQNRDLDTTW